LTNERFELGLGRGLRRVVNALARDDVEELFGPRLFVRRQVAVGLA
jgi:hypothetical protein